MQISWMVEWLGGPAAAGGGGSGAGAGESGGSEAMAGGILINPAHFVPPSSTPRQAGSGNAAGAGSGGSSSPSAAAGSTGGAGGASSLTATAAVTVADDDADGWGLPPIALPPCYSLRQFCAIFAELFQRFDEHWQDAAPSSVMEFPIVAESFRAVAVRWAKDGPSSDALDGLPGRAAAAGRSGRGNHKYAGGAHGGGKVGKVMHAPTAVVGGVGKALGGVGKGAIHGVGSVGKGALGGVGKVGKGGRKALGNVAKRRPSVFSRGGRKKFGDPHAAEFNPDDW